MMKCSMSSEKKKQNDTKNKDRELKDTKQEILFELRLKTEELFKKLKEAKKKDHVGF